MSDDGQDRDRRQDAERRRRWAAAFGEPLPDRTSDEDAEGWGEESRPSDQAHSDEWLRRQVPPHHE